MKFIRLAKKIYKTGINKMKLYIYILLLILPAIGFADSDDHIPVPHTHTDDGICFGYAQARAFSRYENSTCSANTLLPNDINHGHYVNPNYFEYFNSFDYNDVQIGDIVVFKHTGHHVAYVSDKDSPDPDDIYLDHKPSPGEDPEENIPLSDFIEDPVKYGEPVGYYRKKEQWKITVTNSFDAGQVNVKSQNQWQTHPSGWLEDGHDWEDDVSLSAIENGNSQGGYIQRFQYWYKNTESGERKPDETTTVEIIDDYDDDVTWTAKFLSEFNIRFQNHFDGISENGNMEINDTTFSNISFSNIFYVLEGDLIEFQALNQTFNNIDYHLDHWNDGITSSSRTYEPADHKDFTAYFTGIPQQVQNLHEDGAVGAPIHLVWYQHPNQNCKYRVYRKVKQQGNNPVLIATLNNNVTSYTDYDYCKTRTYSDLLLQYDVRAYYTTEYTEAESNWYAIFGNSIPKGGGGRGRDNYENSKIPDSFTLTNFPNPFNPSTAIAYSLPEETDVLIKVYNLNGSYVKTLMHTRQPAGFYSVTWTGSNDKNVFVAAGVYFIRMDVQGKSLVHKVIYIR